MWGNFFLNPNLTRTAWAVFKYCGTRLHHQKDDFRVLRKKI
jgi:hypothetical protein